MREIRIQRQVRLSFARTLEICLSGIYYRLFRSLVTVAIVSVAIAFMMYMLAGSVISKSVQRYARSEAQQYKAYDNWLSWIDEVMGHTSLFRIIARCGGKDSKVRSIKKWGSLSGEQVGELVAVSHEGERYLRFFESLSPGRRFLLAEGTENESLLDWLLDEESFRQFTDRLLNMPSIRLPGSVDDLRMLLDRYRRQIPLWGAIEKGRNEAIVKLRERYPDRETSDLLAALPPDFVKTLEELGFADSSVDFTQIFEKAVREQHLGCLSGLLRNSGFKRDISKRAGINPIMVNMKVFGRLYLSRGGPDFIYESLKRNNIDLALDPEKIHYVFKNYLRESRILQIESESTVFSEGFLGFSNRTLWLIGVSFVVCVVGIANAMLMSVMERFREIATMKCLGATDSFVMVLFVLESCIQGVVGGIFGAVLGLLLSIPVAAFRYGSLVWGMLPFHDISAISLVAVGTGMLLAAIASVYPAYVAARLVPMEAMRVE